MSNEIITPEDQRAQLRESLAAYAHDAWAGWMIYLFAQSDLNPDGTVTIPAWAVERWARQVSRTRPKHRVRIETSSTTARNRRLSN